jgi:flagellar biosynthesis protein FliP
MKTNKISLLWLFLPLTLAISPFCHAASNDLLVITSSMDDDGITSYNLNLQILLLMTVITLLPAILMAITSFTRIIIVLSILRQALGLMQTPSNQTLLGLSLFLSFFIMSPVLERAWTQGLQPYLDDQTEFSEAFEQSSLPFREFMLSQVRQTDLDFFIDIRQIELPVNNIEIPLSVLIPAFMTSELKTAFQIGFMLFIPFLVIDLVVASVLMSMGMMMLSPMLISLPFKIMLFVMIDGWTLVLGTITDSFTV